MSILKTITVKTQVRRLRYFSVCISLLKRTGIKKNILYSKITNWSIQNEQHFNDYGAKSGKITSAKRLPSKNLSNYIEGFLKLHIIDTIDDLVIPTKLSVAIKLLKRLNENGSNRENQFQLSKLEKLFSLYLITKNDASIFYIIISTLNNTQEEIDLNFFRKNYKDIYLNYLERILDKASSREKIQITDTIQRVNNWRNIERYIEDLVPPRLNWMYDLDILNKEKFIDNKYELNSKGLNLAKAVLDKSKLFIDDDFLNSNQFRLYSNILGSDLENWNTISFNTKKRLLKKLFYFSINNFSKVKIPRLSIEQAFFFFSTHLFIKYNILVEFSDLEEFIGQEINIGNKKIGLRKAARKSESYIYIQ